VGEAHEFGWGHIEEDSSKALVSLGGRGKRNGFGGRGKGKKKGRREVKDGSGNTVGSGKGLALRSV